LRKTLIAALALIAVTAGVLAFTRAPAGTSAQTTLDPKEAEFMGLLNNYRAQHSLPPIFVDASIQAAAEWMSADMGAKNYFSHTDSLGRSPWDRMCFFGYCYNTWKGENVAAGYVTAQAVFQGWHDSPGHNSNMLGPNYRVMGIALVETPGSDFRYYWTNDFGGHIVNPPPPPAPTNTPAPPTKSPTASPTASPTPTSTPTPTAIPTASPTIAPTPTPVETPAPTGLPEAADMDCDEQVTGMDSLRILRFVAGVPSDDEACEPVGSSEGAYEAPGASYARGDVDCDGDIDAADAVHILWYAAGDPSAIAHCS
jgi:uncharacterized protein YkwD